MEPFELRAYKDADGDMRVSINGRKDDAIDCFMCVLESVSHFTGMNKIMLAAAALSMLKFAPPDSEYSSMQVDLVADALRKMREGQ